MENIRYRFDTGIEIMEMAKAVIKKHQEIAEESGTIAIDELGLSFINTLYGP